ncbi:Thioesterase superfamily protein [Marinovum algicola]|uniref:Uncharacterized domain 1-containing protein n=1 Tax=Marinovum algicola TaxID=42444 RepID=A0A975WBX3_9RHOB|nr:PaaI family thioesterase [Marinovum algicola]SEJ83529.1 uncharacterized domain 1-containing protein [Marinovum algicola]SLN62242.1 Thioesterase superfamily protein [Marinovum algicola]
MDHSKAIDLLANDMPDDPPEGFKVLAIEEGFNLWIGSVYGKVVDGRLKFGLRIRRRHLNPHGTAHGGLIASLADLQGLSCQKENPDLRFMLMPTVQMSVDYLAPARLGDWVEMSTRLVQQTRSLLFTDTLARADGRNIFRSNAIFRITKSTDVSGSVLGDRFLND